MGDFKKISKKIILIGNVGVGKTSLIRQFVYQKFSENYLTTIGVKIERKEVVIDKNTVSMIIWDIAGEVRQDKVPQNYFLGSHGAIYVVDLTRPKTFENIESDFRYLKSLMPNLVVKLVGNKKDMLSKTELNEMLQKFSIKPNFLTSAKTGENVESIFHALGENLIMKKELI